MRSRDKLNLADRGGARTFFARELERIKLGL